MAKSLEELAAERGFLDPQPPATADPTPTQGQNEPAQEAQEAITGEETQEAKRASEIIKRLPVVQFALDMARDPEDALVSWNMTKRLEEYEKTHFSWLVSTVAKETGADPEQIADKDKRTPEQQAAILELAAEIQRQRMRRFFQSRYIYAIDALSGLQGQYPDPTETNPLADNISVKEQAVLYFFALHEEINPAEYDPPLSEEQIEEIQAIFLRLDAFYFEKTGGDPNADGNAGEIFYAFIEKENPPQPTKHKEAENKGALMTIGERLFVPTDPEYQNAFITSDSANIGLYRVDPESGKQLALDFNTPFIQALAKAFFIDLMNGGTGEMGTQIYFPPVARELGYDLREKPAADTKDGKALAARSEARQAFIHSVIADIDTIWGKLPHDVTEYKLISVLAYNPDTEILYFVSPYLQKLISALVSKEADQLNSGKNYYNWHCDLLHASAANERNPAAVEMATRLLVGVQQRGLKPDAKLKQNKGKNYTDEEAKIVSYHITCKGLIEECPKIREKLKAQPDTRAKTKTLNRTFTAMYRILRKKTDLFSYYDNVIITEVIPTARSLDAEIVITHTGTNPKYKRPNIQFSDN